MSSVNRLKSPYDPGKQAESFGSRLMMMGADQSLEFKDMVAEERGGY